MARRSRLLAGVLGTSLLTGAAIAAPAPIMVVGIDTKFWLDDDGKRVFKPNGGDVVQVYDLTDPAHPALLGSVPLANSVVGPPTNLAVTPDGRLALVANAVDSVADGAGWKFVPAHEVAVIDVAARPPKLVARIKVGAQPSGLAISGDGSMALVTNRADKSVSVLSIHGQEVAVTATVPMPEVVTSAAFSPDGKHALICEFGGHKVAVLDIDQGKVTRSGIEMPVGLWPYSVAITPDGRLGLAGDTGNQGAPDGSMDPVAVIDLAAKPPRTVDFVTAGDSIEGLVVSPRGDYAVATILQGSLGGPKDLWYRHDKGSVALLAIADGKVTLAGHTDVGSFPEGVAFSPDGNWVYAGNFGSSSISVLHLENGKLVDSHADIKLPGPPAALRVGSE